MTTKTETIRALNDELRQDLTVGTALITAGVAALGAEAVARMVKRSPCTTISVTPTTRTKNTTLGRSRSMARRSFSRSIITIKRSLFTRPTRLIGRLPSA
jgi:hypothetical protein